MNWPAMLSYIIINSFTPGPNNILSMTNSAKMGFRKAYPYTIGATCAVFFISLASGYFTTKLYEYIPQVSGVLKWLGAAYMIYLAYYVCVDHPEKPEAERKSTLSPASFWSGVVMQFINPKLIIGALTTLTTYILPFDQSNKMILLFSILMALFAMLFISCWGLFGALFQKIFQKYRKTTSAVMALLLVYCAVSSIIH